MISHMTEALYQGRGAMHRQHQLPCSGPTEPIREGPALLTSRVEHWEVREGGKGTLGKVSLNPEGQRALTITGA